MKSLKSKLLTFFILFFMGFAVSCNINTSDTNNIEGNNIVNNGGDRDIAFYFSVHVGMHGDCAIPQPNAKVTITYYHFGEQVKEYNNTNYDGWAVFTPSADWGTLIEVYTQYNDHFEQPCPAPPPVDHNVYVYSCLNDTACD